MCSPPRYGDPKAAVSKNQGSAQKSSSFQSHRLAATIFRLVEDDSFGENPYIYIKLYPDVIVIVDTGCNAPRQNDNQQVSSLREFLETTPVLENNDQPLNPSGQLPYLILLSHCHYDHIGGLITLGDIPKTTTVAVGSALQSEIIALGNLNQYSLHDELNLPSPYYPAPLRLLDDGENIHWKSPITGRTTDLKLQVMTTPGHSLDSIVVLDHSERVIFLGDSAYEDGWLFYAHGSDLFQQTESLYKVECALARAEHPALEVERPWIAACGHFTVGVDAVNLLRGVQKFILGVLKEEITPSEIGKDHIGRGSSALIKGDRFSMAVPFDQLAASLKRFKSTHGSGVR